MPINLLPDSTVRAIGSSLVLNDACSVVKELVDNALDAKASSIIVEISLDTLDVLQVKDDGHGIGVEDRQLLCKRGCTSKIRTMEDLEKLGGSSLGFRGEALASVAELSESITLTTRLVGERVGTSLKFGRNGTLQNSASASHPVGTTLRIRGFLQVVPVRKEAAKKAASKTLAGIKKLLYNYAFARPSVRFAFKVLRTSNEKANWSYGPKIGPISLQDATSKIAGQEVAAQCELRSAELEQTVPHSAVGELYYVDAVLVRPDGDYSKTHSVGHYLSVDSRPVNAARGIMKDVVKLYKLFYRAASGNTDRASSVNPFLCMHFRWPQESYDVNIEPAKDDLLFSEPSKVMALAEKLFGDYYGELVPDNDTRIQPTAKRQLVPSVDETFELLLARKVSVPVEKPDAARPTDPTPLEADVVKRKRIADAQPSTNMLNEINGLGLEPEPSRVHSQDRNRPGHPQTEEKSNGGRSKPYFNMYSVDEDDLLATEPWTSTQPLQLEKADELEVGNAHVTNPWSLAKLHAPPRRSVTQSTVQVDSHPAIQLMTPGFGRNDPPRDVQRLSPRQNRNRTESNLLSPAASSPSPAAYQNPGPPLRRRAYNDRQSSDDDDIESTQEAISNISDSRHTSTLDTWVRPERPIVHTPPFQHASTPFTSDRGSGAADKTGFHQRVGSLEVLSSTQLTEPRETHAAPLLVNKNVWKPFKSPFKGPSGTSAPSHEARLFPHNASPPSKRRPVATDGYDRSSLMPPPPSPSQRSFKMSQTPNAELAEILEFEERKKAAVSRERRSQSSRTHGELNPAQLTRLQCDSNDTASVQISSSQMRRSLPSLDLREEQSNPGRSFDRRFAESSDAEAPGMMHRSSPHRNRYLAAKERLALSSLGNDHVLNPRQPDTPIFDAEDLSEEAGHFPEEADIRLSKDDPRSYLAQHSRSGKKTTSSTGLTKTGLQIHGTKTTKLPLETIRADAANHGLKAIPPDPFPGVPALATMNEQQGHFDEYVRAGTNSFVRWSANSRDVAVWETTLNKLIAKAFEAKLAGGEVVTPQLKLMLTTAIKTHADAHDL